MIPGDKYYDEYFLRPNQTHPRIEHTESTYFEVGRNSKLTLPIIVIVIVYALYSTYMLDTGMKPAIVRDVTERFNRQFVEVVLMRDCNGIKNVCFWLWKKLFMLKTK